VSQNDPNRDYTQLARHYTQLARHYDTRWASYIRATALRTLERAGVQPAERVLDVGCGSGVMLAELHRRNPAARLTGIDLLPPMLDIARRRLPAAVDLQIATAENLPFADATFDVLLSANVIHYLKDPGAALSEWSRVLRSGGRLVITDWCADYLSIRLLGRFLRRYRPAHERAHRLDDFRARLTAHGFRVTVAEKYKLDWLWGLMTLGAVAAPRAAAPVTTDSTSAGGR
jgi:ubiquinone/menaquinone biosynthesis C-methylase UbiE